jgi:hypothetical protein
MEFIAADLVETAKCKNRQFTKTQALLSMCTAKFQWATGAIVFTTAIYLLRQESVLKTLVLWKFIAFYLKLAFPCPVPPACVQLWRQIGTISDNAILDFASPHPHTFCTAQMSTRITDCKPQAYRTHRPRCRLSPLVNHRILGINNSLNA